MELNRAKVDPAIIAAVDNRQDPYDKGIGVSIETDGPAGAEQETILRRLGATEAPQENIWMAVLTEPALIDLSNQPWIKLLSRTATMEELFDRSSGVESSAPGPDSIFHHPV